MPAHSSARPSASRRGSSASAAGSVGTAVALLLPLTACSATPSSATTPRTLGAWAAVFEESVRHDSGAACRSLFTDMLGNRTCRSLMSTVESSFSAVADSSQPDTLNVTWQIGSAPVRQSVHVGWDDSEGRRVVGQLTQVPGKQAPLWIEESLPVATSDGITLAGECIQGTRLRAAAARDAVKQADLGDLAQGWDNSLVVECPSSRASFNAVTNNAPGAFDGIAAAAWPLGSGDATAVHVILNPDEPDLGDTGAFVLRHEAVHVATRSYRWTTTWITEGLADAVAVDPAYRATSDAQVRADVAAHGVPSQLPANADFDAPAARLNLTYGYARLAVETLRDKVGWERARKVLAAWSHGSTADAEGVSQAQLLAWWQEALRG